MLIPKCMCSAMSKDHTVHEIFDIVKQSSLDWNQDIDDSCSYGTGYLPCDIL